MDKNDKQDVVLDDEKRAAAERARLRAVLASQINIYDDPVSSGAVSPDVTEEDIEEAIADSFDKMIREHPDVLVARLRDALECELPDVDLDGDEPADDPDDPVNAWWPKKKLRGTPVSVRGTMALFVVKSDYDRGEHGRLLERVKAGVANEWRVSSKDIWHVEVRSLHAHQLRTYLIHPSMRGTLILNPTSEQSEMMCELLWRLGGERRMLDVIRKNPWMATTPPKGTPTHKAVGMDLSVPLGLWSMLMIRDGVEDKLHDLLPKDLAWETDDVELLEGCNIPQAKAEDPKGDKRALFADAMLRVEIFDERDVLKAKDRAAVLSPEAKQRMTLALDRLLERTSHRRLVLAPDPPVLEGVARKHPNFARLTEFLSGQVGLARLHGGGLTWPPVLMVGPPGVGKTEFSHALADALGLGDDHELVPMSSVSSGFILSGLSPMWQSARPGRVAARLTEGDVINPLIVLDEIEKAGQGDPRYGGALAPLYSLLEPGTAKAFQDEFYEGVKIDASRVLWLATANSLETIPDPILSRFVVFKIDALDVEQTRSVAASMYQQMMEEPIGNHFSPELPVDVLDALQIMTPRELRLSLTRALGRAALRPHSGGGLRRIAVEDLMTDEPTNASRGIGFCASL